MGSGHLTLPHTFAGIWPRNTPLLRRPNTELGRLAQAGHCMLPPGKLPAQDITALLLEAQSTLPRWSAIFNKDAPAALWPGPIPPCHNGLFDCGIAPARGRCQFSTARPTVTTAKSPTA